MSYDLHLVRAGMTAIDAAELVLGDVDPDNPNPGAFSPAAEARKAHLTQALRSVNPALEPFAFDYAEIARFLNISEEDARLKWRHIELNGPDGGNGIQITLHDETATVTVPYWHHGIAANTVWEEIWTYLTVLKTDGGLDVYDPQLDRILDLSTDLGAVLSTYGGVVGSVDQVAAKLKKPWWKFW